MVAAPQPQQLQRMGSRMPRVQGRSAMNLNSSETATVLVVDDIEANRMLLERHLMRLGCHVLTAEHGRQALDLLATHSVDMILLDLMMPVMDGFATLAALKEDPELRQLPVVVVSALDDVESIARCVSLGAVDFLGKPVERRLLQARVEASLERKRLNDRVQAAHAAAEAAHRSKDAFVSMVSHELNNQLTGILGYADMLHHKMLGPLNDEQSEFIASIRRLSRMMKSVLADITDLSKIEAGILRLELAPTSLATCLHAALGTIRSLMEEQGHRLTTPATQDLPLVLADEVRLTQVLTNLLSNAAKYTPPQGEIWVHVQRNGSGLVEIAVQDSGQGIPLEEQSRLFEPFFRSASATNGSQPGTGLGLNITRQLVELQGGKISFSSVPGEGTTFRFTLPEVG